jgi:hypothetical protein
MRAITAKAIENTTTKNTDAALFEKLKLLACKRQEAADLDEVAGTPRRLGNLSAKNDFETQKRSRGGKRAGRPVHLL